MMFSPAADQSMWREGSLVASDVMKGTWHTPMLRCQEGSLKLKKPMSGEHRWQDYVGLLCLESAELGLPFL